MREIVSNPVSKAFDSQLLQSPMHSASTPGAFEDLQSSGFSAGDGRHGNKQISGEAQDVLWKLEECKVRIADDPGVS